MLMSGLVLQDTLSKLEDFPYYGESTSQYWAGIPVGIAWTDARPSMLHFTIMWETSLQR